MLANAVGQVEQCHELIFFAGKRAPTGRDYVNARFLWVRSGRVSQQIAHISRSSQRKTGRPLRVDPFFTPLLLYFKCTFSSCDACSIADRTSGTWLTTFNSP